MDSAAQDDDGRTADLVWKLEHLGRSYEPGRAKEALRLLEEGRRSGIKDLKAYNAALRVRHYSCNIDTATWIPLKMH